MATSRTVPPVVRLLCGLVVVGVASSMPARAAGEPGHPVAAIAGVPPSATVRMVYLIPSDRTADARYTAAIERAARHLQIWYAQQMDDGTTFALADPVVAVVPLPRPVAWYNGDPATPFSFWFRVLEDAFFATGGAFFDPVNRWVYLIHADPACGQGIGGTSGVALLGETDLRGLVGEPFIPACPGEEPRTEPVCRWIGGIGHELGHAFELPHPPQCEDGTYEDVCFAALMYFGYLTYPEAILIDADRARLRSGGFFAGRDDVPPSLPPCGCGDGVADSDEECDDGNFLDGDGCSAACVAEFPACPRMPAARCAPSLEPATGRVRVKEKPKTGQRRIDWTWRSGPALTIDDFGVPPAQPGARLCVYEANGLHATAAAPGGPGWRVTRRGVLQYRPVGRATEGLVALTVRPGDSLDTAFDVEAVVDASKLGRIAELELPLVLQLHAPSGRCYTSTFADDGITRRTETSLRGVGE